MLKNDLISRKGTYLTILWFAKLCSCLGSFLITVAAGTLNRLVKEELKTLYMFDHTIWYDLTCSSYQETQFKSKMDIFLLCPALVPGLCAYKSKHGQILLAGFREPVALCSDVIYLHNVTTPSYKPSVFSLFSHDH
uniref:Uncharacterized protein n=1 Tax=Glossina austeni TaxID=7395 RepID=A0A1A9UFE3_GLOAU